MSRDTRRGGSTSTPRWVLFAVLAVFVLFYWTPLLAPNATIQWDAVDVHYSSQQYFAAEVKSGRLPFWTPYIYSGFPFLADPQVGAFYPLNWPFFLIGITPAAIQAELALHALIAVAGAFLLLRRLTDHLSGSLCGALAYGLGGFFAAHSSHVGMFQGAALLPWLIYCFERAVDAGALRWIACTGLVAGGIVLAGHFQTALYAMLALALYTIWRIAGNRSAWKRAVAVLAASVALGGCLASVLILPGMELTGESIRAGADYSSNVDGTLSPGALGTLIKADWLGALSGRFQGGADVTQFYFYSGILLLPLAAYGMMRKPMRVLAVLLVLLPVWYMLGPGAGLYRLGAVVPYLYKVRAPVNGWFVAALGLAILAAVGVAEAEKRFKKAWLGFILAGVFAVDLCVFNSWNNPLAYGRISYDEMYGKGEKALREKVIPLMQAGMRLHAPERLAIFGSLNSPLQARVEATYGYNPLELAAYHDYRLAAEKNEKLLNGLSAMTIVVPKEENVKGNPDFLSRVFFALEVIDVASDADSRARLASLDPAKQALAATPHAPIRQDPAAEVLSLDLKDASMRVRCSAASPSLLTATNPLYPGWRVSVDGVPAEIVRVNHALMGVVVPGGSHDVFFEYVPRRFTLGAVLSALALLVALLGVFRAPAATESPAAQPDRPEAPPRRRRPR